MATGQLRVIAELPKNSHLSIRIHESCNSRGLVQLTGNACPHSRMFLSPAIVPCLYNATRLGENSEFTLYLSCQFHECPPPSSNVSIQLVSQSRPKQLCSTGKHLSLGHFSFLDAKQGRDVSLRHDCSNFQLQHPHTKKEHWALPLCWGVFDFESQDLLII